MIETLQNIDASLLLWLNGFHDSFFDALMLFISNKYVWIPMYTTIIVVCGIKYGMKKQMFSFLALFVIAFAITDYTCASIIRPLVCRPRPTSTDSPIFTLVHIVDGYHGGHYGFPSCHAANSFMLAAMVTLFFRKRYLSIFMYAWAVIHSYSRIYLGVHYPGDILLGAILGTMFAFSTYYLMKRIKMLHAKDNFNYINYIQYIGIATFALLIFSATVTSLTSHPVIVKL